MPKIQTALSNTVNLIGSKTHLRDKPLSMPVRDILIRLITGGKATLTVVAPLHGRSTGLYKKEKASSVLPSHSYSAS